MPRIELIDVPLFGPNDPIHWQTENIPLESLMTRQNLINMALDNVIEQIRDAIGTQNTIANRLNQSLDPDGSLKATAIDDAAHSIEEHTDSTNFVRMTAAQSAKLDLVSDEATDVALQVTDGTSTIDFTSGVVKLQPSDTVTMSVTAPDILKFNLAFPASAAHQHFYGLDPVHANIVDPDYTNYQVNATPSPFVEGSLRVYVNGVRIFSDEAVYVPGSMVEDAWTLLSFTPDHAAGTFELSAALSDEDIIRIDFDIALSKETSLRVSTRSTKHHLYNRDCICVVGNDASPHDFKKFKEYCPTYKGRDTIASLINTGFKRLEHEWGLLIFAGNRFQQFTERKFFFAQKETDILFPVHNQKSNFLDAPLDCLLINKKTFDTIGNWPEYKDDKNALEHSKLVWMAGVEVYHWSIGEESPYNWKFCIKDDDRIVADRVPCMELHVQYNENRFARIQGVDGSEFHAPTEQERLGQIHIYHPSNDTYNSYLEDMYDNETIFDMELWPNLRTDTINRFHDVRMTTINYFPLGEIEVVEVKWTFESGNTSIGTTMDIREGSILRHILDADPTDIIEMESQLHGWAEMDSDEIQKLDWKQFGF
ncbi:unnamed protein product [Symbiodinium microadriaticum]|nr:unnamed protein product [Symbiodinium microadriaticum]